MLSTIMKSCRSRELGEQKEASVLFVDIADYAELAEQAPLMEVVDVLRRYFRIAGKIIKASHGKIIDYYGDGFLAIFGLDGDVNHSANLIKAGFALQGAIDKFEKDIRTLTDRDFLVFAWVPIPEQ